MIDNHQITIWPGHSVLAIFFVATSAILLTMFGGCHGNDSGTENVVAPNQQGTTQLGSAQHDESSEADSDRHEKFQLSETVAPPRFLGEVIESDTSPTNATIRILFFGNSHTVYHNVPRLIQEMLSASTKKHTVHYIVLTAGFLEDALGHDLSIIESGDWDIVVLQGQKISVSGNHLYSTTAAVDLCNRGSAARARPILYSEWGRLGIEGETERIQTIYQGIADETNAELAATGAAWELAFKHDDTLRLHTVDGNHSTLEGAFLAASVLYAKIEGEDPRALPYIDTISLPPAKQKLFHEFAFAAAKRASKE